VIDAPPLDEGAVHDNKTCISPDTPTTEVGTPGTPATSTPVDDVEYAPVPTLFTAATLKMYVEPFVKPETVVVVVVDVPSANVDQLDPEFDEYCTT
jgi:hypothetical protein